MTQFFTKNEEVRFAWEIPGVCVLHFTGQIELLRQYVAYVRITSVRFFDGGAVDNEDLGLFARQPLMQVPLVLLQAAPGCCQ